MRKRSRTWLLLWLAVFPAALAAAPPPAVPLQGLDPYVQQVMRDWQVPGVAIAVVQDGKVVLARGYGVRELGKPGKVDADTLFDIASNTKAFTAAALGTLVAAGRLQWDTRVADVLQWFRLDDSYVGAHLTLRDLLTHRSGYCDPTMAWYTSDADDILQRVRFQKPAYGFRSTFCYNNVQYLAAGRFIPELTGASWNAYVASHLLQPLGMARTVTTTAAAAASANVAVPHGLVEERPAAIRGYWPHNADIFAPVGGIWSSANDLSHWMEMLLANGQYAGTAVLPATVVAAMETPQMPISADTAVGGEIRAAMPGGTFYAYGLGLIVQDDGGHTLAWHAGDIDGMASALVLVPAAKLGVVVLTNMNAANARFAIVARVLQSMLGLPPHDLEPVLLAEARRAQAAAAAEAAQLAATRVPGSPPPLPLTAYAGTYSDALAGTARVAVEHGHLVLYLGNPDFTGDLALWHGSTFRVTWRQRFYGDDYATFDIDARKRPLRLTLAGLSLDYERSVPPANGATPAGH